MNLWNFVCTIVSLLESYKVTNKVTYFNVMEPSISQNWAYMPPCSYEISIDFIDKGVGNLLWELLIETH